MIRARGRWAVVLVAFLLLEALPALGQDSRTIVVDVRRPIAAGAEASIAGRVVDETGLPVAGRVVALAADGAAFGAQVGIDGGYVLRVVRNASYSISATAVVNGSAVERSWRGGEPTLVAGNLTGVDFVVPRPRPPEGVLVNGAPTSGAAIALRPGAALTVAHVVEDAPEEVAAVVAVLHGDRPAGALDLPFLFEAANLSADGLATDQGPFLYPEVRAGVDRVVWPRRMREIDEGVYFAAFEPPARHGLWRASLDILVLRNATPTLAIASVGEAGGARFAGDEDATLRPLTMDERDNVVRGGRDEVARLVASGLRRNSPLRGGEGRDALDCSELVAAAVQAAAVPGLTLSPQETHTLSLWTNDRKVERIGHDPEVPPEKADLVFSTSLTPESAAAQKAYRAALKTWTKGGGVGPAPVEPPREWQEKPNHVQIWTGQGLLHLGGAETCKGEKCPFPSEIPMQHGGRVVERIVDAKAAALAAAESAAGSPEERADRQAAVEREWASREEALRAWDGQWDNFWRRVLTSPDGYCDSAGDCKRVLDYGRLLVEAEPDDPSPVEGPTCSDDDEPDVPSIATFVDPSGYVTDAATGDPIEGATVTLLRRDPRVGTFAVPDANLSRPPTNPLRTDARGHYAWDVVPGRYRVRVEAEGYEARESRVVDVPPPVFDLDLALDRHGATGAERTFRAAGVADARIRVRSDANVSDFAYDPARGSASFGVGALDRNASFAVDLPAALLGGPWTIRVAGGAIVPFAARAGDGATTLEALLPASAVARVVVIEGRAPPPPAPEAPLGVAPAAESTGPGAFSFDAGLRGGTPPVSLVWRFGDGSTAYGSAANHTFGAGSFDVVLTAVDAAGVVSRSAPLRIEVAAAEPERGFPLVYVVAGLVLGVAAVVGAIVAVRRRS